MERAQARVFVDTGAFGALSNRRDDYYDEAILILQGITARGATLLTTNFVIAESHALLLARANRDIAERFLREIYESAVTIERVEIEDEERARDIIYRYTDKRFSMVDATSFAVMERLGLTLFFAFNGNFSQYGFTPAQP